MEKTGNRQYSDSIFRYLFKDAENFVKLYEMLSGNLLLPDQVEFKDTESMLVETALKNDVAFMTKDNHFIILIEHQLTENPNMGLRMLMYYSELLHRYIKKHKLNIYGSKLVKYPEAEFFIAYNGRRPWKNKDLTIEAGDLTIRARLVDVKYDKLDSEDVTHPLVGYAYLIKQAQYYEREENFTRLEALQKAVEDCKANGYLDDHTNKEEFLTMLPDVYTIEQQLIDQLEYGIEQGIEQERQKALAEKKKIKEQVAEKLLNKGMSFDEITDISGLSEAEIKQLK